jgi:hypothetical protein
VKPKWMERADREIIRAQSRNPVTRAHMRANMMARLQLEVQLKEAEQRKQEIDVILDQQEFGKTKPKRRKKVE